MTINLSIPQENMDIRPKITVVGIGGAGGNAVNNMIRSKLEGVEFIVANTDAQGLNQSLCERRIQLGAGVTKGLGAGARPDVGRAAAEEAMREIAEQLSGSNMAFITAGMGGGTGTGAAPVVAQIAREQGILTVGVITKPFHFEGAHRMRLADAGIQELQQYVDTLIIIPNQNLFRVANEKTTFADAFKMADEVLHSGVRGVTDLMVMPGLINLDFADIRAVMSEMGKAMMGTGEASGDNRAIAAAEAAISNPLLDEVSMKGARGVLINITGGMDMTLFEVDEAANRIRDEVDPEANIIFGSTFDQSLDGRIRISVVATGIESQMQAQPRPMGVATLSVVANNASPRMAVPAASTGAPTAAVATPAMATASVGATALQAQPLTVQPVTVQPATAQAAVAPQAAAPTQNKATGEQPFIAPPAVEPARRLELEAAAYPVQRRTPSLFEKVTSRLTGHGSAAPVAAPTRPAPTRPAESMQVAKPQAQEPVAQAPAMPVTQTATAQSFAVQAPAVQAPAVQAQVMQQPSTAPVQTQMAAQVAQPRLDLDPMDRLTATRAEDDLLDIPAFLRRQAN